MERLVGGSAGFFSGSAGFWSGSGGLVPLVPHLAFAMRPESYVLNRILGLRLSLFSSQILTWKMSPKCE